MWGSSGWHLWPRFTFFNEELQILMYGWICDTLGVKKNSNDFSQTDFPPPSLGEIFRENSFYEWKMNITKKIHVIKTGN